ncbi:MAG: gamma-glutamyl-gamma-aminobutyrate hydrolase family protein [Dysgonamonadaceae bacterium]|jgi:microsomal dipeptidase-like Zn-dependent dipeptidase/gamma-glutamyl-gamma-aminobutyrate hydrolase PuuD|nr:gamma-glutamyl-gamma-aminobutyrate hydrolase family protein [Dysgonamonadaceae bacterium]
MLIGITSNYIDNKSCLADAYTNAVIEAGGIPVMIPLTTDKTVLENIISNIDGLILSGGGDIYSPLFGEKLHPTVTDYNLDRDKYDLTLIYLATERQMPVLGICRGHQALNVAFGGTLIQDIPSQVPDSKIIHSQAEARDVATHSVRINPESKLYQIIQQNDLPVNSFHHQAIKTVAPGFNAVAFSDDGIIEAIEPEEEKTILGVQWHPETMAVAGNAVMIDTFKYLVGEAALYKKAKEIHQKIITLDSHTDTPMYFKYGIDIGKTNPILKINPKELGAESETTVNYELKVDIPKMQRGMLDAAVMVAYLPQGARTEQASKRAVDKTFSILNTLLRQIDKNKNTVGQAKTAADLQRLKKEGKKAILLGIENGYGIGKDLSNLQKLAGMGVVYITLCHNRHNDICDTHKGKPEHNGLSEYGKKAVKEMNRLGIIVDISHTSEKTSFDVLEVSEYPVIASHSSVKALCNNTRNISDNLMKAIAKKGGVIQVCLYKGFIRENGKATVKDAVDHIDYIVKKVGINHVGIGSDFDGGGELTGLKNAGEMPQITLELLRRGYSEEAISKIWGGNFMRVLKIVKAKK